MSGKDKTGSNPRFARAACIVCGVFDGLMLLPMLIPGLGGKLFGLKTFSPGSDYRYAMNVAASLMLGWTFLLFWASRRPNERATVLLLTAVVVLCLMLAGLCAVLSGFISLRNMLPVFAIQSGLAALCLTAYARASRSNRGSLDDGGE
jgi:hypothetical protein